MSPKLLVIIGITGNQGHSVATRFLQDPTYKIRGLTRNPSSPTAQSLSSKGIEIIQADLNDPASLVKALKGANLIFSVTNYWEPFFRPDCRADAQKQGISCREFAGRIEYAQGVNIADAAAATVDSLDGNGFIVSTLSSARGCTGGKMTEVYHFDAKADVFPGYVTEKYPGLAAKMSCVQTGCFMTSFRLAPGAYFEKLADGSFRTNMPMSPTKPLQHIDINTDLGNFVHAVTRMPPGSEYMAAGTTCTWPDYGKIWSGVTGRKHEYRQVSMDEFIDGSQDREAGREIGEMFVYSDQPGYDGGKKLLGWEDLRAAGMDISMTTLEEFMKRTDWSEVIGGQ